MINKAKYSAICQKWEESELDWGTRPDGYSLHITNLDREKFIQDYWNKMPDNAPYEYSRPCGKPYYCIVDRTIYEKILKSEFGIRKSGKPPNDPKTSGWISRL